MKIDSNGFALASESFNPSVVKLADKLGYAGAIEKLCRKSDPPTLKPCPGWTEEQRRAHAELSLFWRKAAKPCGSKNQSESRTQRQLKQPAEATAKPVDIIAPTAMSITDARAVLEAQTYLKT